MRIRMLTLMAGPEGVFPPGAELELPTPQAQRLLQAGAAVVVESEPAKPTKAKASAKETAAVVPGETPEGPPTKPPKA